MVGLRIAEVLLLGYLVGSFPFGYWAARLKGLDIRQHGSGNIGATNVWRVMGWKWGLPVFILDALKGVAAVWAAGWWLRDADVAPNVMSLGRVVGGMGGILGHTFPFWLKFKGGKGVATSAGVLAALTPVGLGVALVAWMAVFFPTRYVALASVVAAVVLPLALVVMMAWRGVWDWPLLGFGILAGALVVLRHRSNIKRLLAGTELKMASKKS